MMLRRMLLAAAALAALAGAPGRTAGRVAAVIPAHVFKGAAANGPVVTEAVRENLRRHGWEVASAASMERALMEKKIALSRPLGIADLQQIAEATGTDLVVYPRVLSVGSSLGSETPQATILVNVLEKGARSYAHTSQVGQPFRTAEEDTRNAVIPRGDADRAVARLLEPYYAKRK